jgi:hypothetical protein
LGVSDDFALKIIQQIGNYEEIYDRNFDETALPRNLNELMFVEPEGQLFYPPFSGSDTISVPLVDNDNRNVLQEVLDRGFVRVGVRNEAPGLGFADANGNLTGFDVDLGRAVAAAVFGDPNAVEFVGSDIRRPALQRCCQRHCGYYQSQRHPQPQAGCPVGSRLCPD